MHVHRERYYSEEKWCFGEHIVVYLKHDSGLDLCWELQVASKGRPTEIIDNFQTREVAWEQALGEVLARAATEDQ